ncbi:KamA family radical SAM protein [Desulfoprunum benzoelyticum]|uniref:Lysine 2,3-aminomutase n=1 Tax=Desulfoprunum benzoelyticum TaxID=1506996 RepID=A0A840UZW6_9BACT|nr:KamA family radical SAM protein [Desulfoprunum benzoelyticum]MBB5348188.1 lysine 2,3-aminomutase [Desulfoprunum benzoelyticum]MBM9530884.1 KamA family radical SAM protein [Desulfoprunum benzoelyticum]
MHCNNNQKTVNGETLDSFTMDLLNTLAQPATGAAAPSTQEREEINTLADKANTTQLTTPIITLFARLLELHRAGKGTPGDFGLNLSDLEKLAVKHQRIDEHMVSVGGRLTRARPIAASANRRVDAYLAAKDSIAPSGIEAWDRILENKARIMAELGMDEAAWNSFPGQIRHAIDSVAVLARLIDLPPAQLESIAKVTQSYRMRLTPYYTSLIMPGAINDPIMLQSVPTGEMVENAGIEIPPVAADHSPARLVDQFYPRVLTIKATNMCAMFCTHCLRLAHIGRKDQVYAKEAYTEALDYIRANDRIRDVLITGGDAFVLPNSMIEWLLAELDGIDHVRLKRLGTRIPVTAPMRVDDELLDILEASNDRKPIRVVTQINTAQEITPVSREVFRRISKRTFAVLNQAVLLKGINDTRVKMWKLCETVHESYVRPYYLFNCSYRNPQFAHFRVPLEVGRDIVESMYGNISGDAIPRYIATAGGKIPLHRSNVVSREGNDVILKKPWSGEEVSYPDADPEIYANELFAFNR